MIFPGFFHSNAELGDFPATFDTTPPALDTEQLLLREGLQGPGPAREDHRRLRHGDGGGFPNGNPLVKDNYIDITWHNHSISFSAFFWKWLAVYCHYE